MDNILNIASFQENLQRVEGFWLNTPETKSWEMKCIPEKEKKKAQKALSTLLKQIDKELKANREIRKALTISELDESFRIRLEGYFREFIIKDSILGLNNLTEGQKEAFFRSTEDFLDAARSFDQELSPEDIGQALRNVWIINILQAIMGEKVCLTSSILGYSLLYPYTDNYLDDSTIEIEEKALFNTRLMGRLKGDQLEPLNSHEEKVYSLVGLIEKDYNRDTYQELYIALQYINMGQIESVSQQYSPGNKSPLTEAELLKISLLKGGASVLVDGYLVRGRLTPEEMDFALGYGFMLQLGDDLQDVEEDYENKHETLMTTKVNKEALDSLATRLINFTEKLINELSCARKEEEAKLKELIKTNCIMLVLFSVVKAEKYFSEEYIKDITVYLPYSVEYIHGLRDKIDKWYRNFD